MAMNLEKAAKIFFHGKEGEARPDDESPRTKVTLPYVRFIDDAFTPDPEMYDRASFKLDEWRKDNGIVMPKRRVVDADPEELA